MCTVTYLPVGEETLLTSSRDVHISRSKALPPDIHDYPDGRILHPLDPDGGGTWCAVHERGWVVILLNGAFFPHRPAPPYRMSRGRLPLILSASPCPVRCFQTIDLTGVEPFTCILHRMKELIEVRWDGSEKYIHEMDASGRHIWSSCTLYDHQTSVMRARWFDEWVASGQSEHFFSIRDFHLQAGDGDPASSLLMSRPDGNATVSITSLRIDQLGCKMSYLGLGYGDRSWKDIRIDYLAADNP